MDTVFNRLVWNFDSRNDLVPCLDSLFPKSFKRITVLIAESSLVSKIKFYCWFLIRYKILGCRFLFFT